MNIYFQKGFQRGFGTYPLKGADLRSAVDAAIDAGYRAFDTAQMYGNEADTGAALAACGVARQELCITTKVHPDNYSEEKFLPSVEASLKALQIDRVDALLLHWPPVGGDVTPSLRLLQSARDRDLADTIGVSNYTARMMHVARSVVDAPLVTNQVEFHPWSTSANSSPPRRRRAFRSRPMRRLPVAKSSSTAFSPKSAKPTASRPRRSCCAGSCRRACR